MKSNISIRSNIYNRSSDNISRDQDYVSQVRGRELIKQIKSKYCLPFLRYDCRHGKKKSTR